MWKLRKFKKEKDAKGGKPALEIRPEASGGREGDATSLMKSNRETAPSISTQNTLFLALEILAQEATYGTASGQAGSARSLAVPGSAAR